jgi:hypothetical protein
MSIITLSPLNVNDLMWLYKNTEKDVVEVAYSLMQKILIVSKSHVHISSHGSYELTHKWIHNETNKQYPKFIFNALRKTNLKKLLPRTKYPHTK